MKKSELEKMVKELMELVAAQTKLIAELSKEPRVIVPPQPWPIAPVYPQQPFMPGRPWYDQGVIITSDTTLPPGSVQMNTPNHCVSAWEVVGGPAAARAALANDDLVNS